MKKLSKTVAVSSMLAATMLFTGCGTTTLQTKAKLTRTVVLDHSQKENKVIYLQVTNTAGSGGENMELYKDVKEKLEAKGYTVATTSKGAAYGLFVNVLFANNLREANAIKAAGAGLSTGAGVGYIASGGSGKDALIAGAALALGSAIVGKAMEDEIFRAVVDISIRDYQDAPVRTVKTSSASDTKVHNVRRSGNLNQLAGAIGDKDGAGDMNSGISEVTTTETEKNYEEFKTRAFVEAIKMKLKVDEALPILQAKISRQISNLF
ncbi:MAG: complement resistance protein TraT [Campylobacterota bacterium]|nr:complement resistance protein TraT [Campylobacterota bacterium]